MKFLLSFVFYIISLCDKFRVYISILTPVDDKSNEITAIPDLLDLIDIEDYIISIDAIGTQKDIVSKIVNDKHAHYCLSVKNNQKSLFFDISEYFKFALNDKYELLKLSVSSSSNKDYGRIESAMFVITLILSMTKLYGLI